jgi:hypothetical protein
MKRVTRTPRRPQVSESGQTRFEYARLETRVCRGGGGAAGDWDSVKENVYVKPATGVYATSAYSGLYDRMLTASR